jgi:competence protein ComEC
MPQPTIYFWIKAPFVRLFMALVAGILLQWWLQLPFLILMVFFISCLVLIVVYFLLPLKGKYRFGYLNGIVFMIIIALTGAMLVWLQDVRNNKNWIGNNADSGYLLVTITEPLVEKANSFKAMATINGQYYKNGFEERTGQILLYFQKDPSVQQLHYGSLLFINKPLQEIKNTGNPGSFDYRRYCLFQGITHQLNLSPGNFILLPEENKSWFRQFVFTCRSRIVKALQKSIHGEKERGLAEALLIGYKDDLDRNLVQAYTNTGVVHIIAISGMHLALIYGLLILLTKSINRKKLRGLRLVLILSGLWLFALLAGAQASVIRSAVMFTCIACGEALSRRSSVYNTLALSAFVLLIYNPFWLWDVGFQLSYAAVLSIVIFYKPVYNWVYFPNKALDFVWKTTAISLAAQLLTTPFSLYHFHQFPVLFLLTNLVAVPLSGIILFCEIALCLLAWLPPVANLLGQLTKLLIYWMNSYIERIETIRFSLWDGFSISVVQTVLLLGATTLICFWLMEKKKRMLRISLGCCLAFTALRSWSVTQANAQKKLIVYNIPKCRAIDLVAGRTCNFIGDSLLLDDFVRNFHIRPCRILYRFEQKQILPACCTNFQFCNKRIAVINSTDDLTGPQQSVDILILSKNPKVYMTSLLKRFSVGQIVIDSSVPQWKAKRWEQDCDSLKIPCYNVGEKGAFVMNL